jgi:Glycosyl transferase family 90/Stf0 sulphotransferase
MTQLLSQKNRHDREWYCSRPRAKVLFAIASIVGMGIFSGNTFLLRLESDVDAESFSDLNYLQKDQRSDLHIVESDRSHDEKQHLGNENAPIDSATKDVFRIAKGEASSSLVPLNFYSIVSDPRSGAEYIMSILDQHESICSSGTFPKSALLPNTMPWMGNDSLEKGCTLAYIRESILDITSTPDFGDRCAEGYDSSNDELRNHLVRFCAIVKALKGDYTNEAVTRIFINSFSESNESAFTGCECPSTTRARVLKISADWIGETLPVESSRVKGSKIIRLTRRNLFERYMSFVVAHTTGQWMIRSEMEKSSQLNHFREMNYLVDIDEMLEQMKSMQESFNDIEKWVNENGSQILWIDHSQIRDDPMISFQKMIEFLGVGPDSDTVTGYKHRLKRITDADGSLSLFDGKALLEFIANKEQVVEALWANGYGSFIGVSDEYKPLHYLVFPESELYHAPNTQRGLRITIINGDNQFNAAVEPSARFLAAVPFLENLPYDSVVVLSNGRAGGLSPRIRRASSAFGKVSEIRSLLLASNRVIVSASDKCCSDAMVHSQPGAFFLPNGHRDARTCKITECKTLESSDTSGWSETMHELSVRQHFNQRNHIYLDGSFIAGKAGNVLNFIKELDVLSWEDDRAVLSDYMYRFPDKIVLDYEQRLFAPSFDGVISKMDLDCSFKNADENILKQNDTASSSLFVYTSKWMQSCERKDHPGPYPHWDGNGIPIKPILEHIHRVLTEDDSMAGIDRHFDREILYIVDNKGLWASEVRRDKYRVKPTEAFLVSALHALQADPSVERWKTLRKVIQSTGFPFWAWYGDWKDCNFHNVGEHSIPLYTTCASTACNHSFPMPSYMTIIDSQPDTQGWYRMFRQFDEKYSWDSKIRKVVWRGALSENNPSKVFDSQRWRFCKAVTSLTDPEEQNMFDIGLTNIPEFLTAQIEIDASIVGGIVKGISSMNDFQNYFAVLDMDGNSWSSRFGTLLCYNSVAIKVEPAYADYFFYDLVPWKHYIPIKNDLSDLLENVAFVLDPANDSIMKEIVASANQWCAERFTHPGLIRDMLDIWERYIQLLDRQDPKWSSAWEEKKSALFSSSSTIPLVPLK